MMQVWEIFDAEDEDLVTELQRLKRRETSGEALLER